MIILPQAGNCANGAKARETNFILCIVNVLLVMAKGILRAKMANSQQQFNAGWYDVGDESYYFRSGGEYHWALYLLLLKDLGEIVDFSYEPRTFWFEKIRRGTNSYKPDFLVLYEEDGERTHRWQEYKGYLKQKNVTQFRRMAKYYPDEKIILVMERIPETRTRKNTELFRRLENAEKYIERIMDAEKILKEVGL